MKRWIQLLAIAGLVGVPAISPLSAQDHSWSDDEEDALVILDERLEDLGDNLSRAVIPHIWWTDEACEDEEGCNVRIAVDDDHHYVIVNGDTVRSGPAFGPHMGDFAYKFGKHMGRMSHDFFGGPHGMHGDSKLRKLERESRRLAKKARMTDGDEKAALVKELDEKLNEIFDYKLERQEKAIDRAEKRLSKLKERRSKRASAKDDIIQNRKDELLGTARYLEW